MTEPIFLEKNNLAKLFKNRWQRKCFHWWPVYSFSGIHVILKSSYRAEVESYGNLDVKTLSRAYVFDKPC